MPRSYSVKEVQANLPRLLTKASRDHIAIRQRDKIVAYLISPDRMEAISETLELMANPAAMKIIRGHECGKVKFTPLSSLDAKS